MYYRGNPFATLNNLPDSPRLGAKLLALACFFWAARFAWPHLAPNSFAGASAIAFRYDAYLLHPHGQHASPDVLGDWLIIGAILFTICGLFVFFRRGFWWVAERRPESSIPDLNLK